MEERPAHTVALIRKFLDGPPAAYTVASSADGDLGEDALLLRSMLTEGLS
jgi:hypothetical protein